jgi:hypothetical protein
VYGVHEIKFVWAKDSNKICLLFGMMRERVESYEEVELKMDGNLSCRRILRMCSRHEVLDVKSKLVDF